jgi:DNA-binding PadR family transcriptional regulator
MEDVFFGDLSDPGKFWRFASAKGPGRGHHRRLDDVERLAVRHMRGGPPFGGGPMFGPPWGRGRGRRRRGDVRTALLLLLAEEPRNGYQLMQAIEERSGGRWRPSPGSVYPILSQLEDEGLVRATERDGAKLFELTDAAREQVAAADAAAPPWDAGDDPAAEAFHELGHLIGDVARAAAQVLRAGDSQQVQKALGTLIETRRSLYRILAEDEDA